MQKRYSPFQGSSPPLSAMEGKYQQVQYYISLPHLSSKDSFIKCSVKRLSAGQSLFPVRPESVFIIVKSIFKGMVPHEHVNEASHMQEITALSLPI